MDFAARSLKDSADVGIFLALRGKRGRDEAGDCGLLARIAALERLQHDHFGAAVLLLWQAGGQRLRQACGAETCQ
jgi:hypothetical protein